MCFFFFFQAEDGIRDFHVTGVQTCALPIARGGAMQVRDIMTREVLTVGPQENLREIARTLRDHEISSVVVTEGQAPLGIVTERDVVHVVAEGLDPASTPAGDRMTRDLVTVAPKTDVAGAADLMAEHGIRHLPVV